MNRDDLISICERSIVPWEEWNDRDSFVSQLNVNECYGLLSAGADFDVLIEGDTISVKFKNLTKEIIEKSWSFNLPYDDVELYQEANPDFQMFEYYATVEIDAKETSCYLPTEERLRKGGDWY